MRVLDEAIERFLTYYPSQATHMGLHEYDLSVPDLSREGMEKFLDWVPDCLAKLKEWESGSLELDRDQIVRELEQALIYVGEWRFWKYYPVAPSTASDLLISIITSPIPKSFKEAALAARMKKLPELFERSKELLEKPKELWVQLARAELQGLKLLLVNMNAPEEVKEAVEEYDKWLDSLEPDKGFEPIGEELFERLLESRYIKMSPAELASLARKKAKELREELEEAPPGKEVESAKEVYAEAVKRAKTFVTENKIVPLAPDEELDIMDTPEPLRPTTPYAAYLPPEAFSPFNLGFLLVTPGAAKRDYFDILNTAVHETYPGHHVQLSTHLPTRYRYFAASTDYIEGWAHYTEELMLEKGFEKHERYVWQVKRDMLWRWVRVYIDVELSTGRMSFEEAVKELVETAMLDEKGAYAEVLRYTLTPGYQLSYAYGKMRIKEIKEIVKELEGSKFSEYEFHGKFLKIGALPVDLIKEKVEGFFG